jgi:hypothetical protein
MLAIVMMMMMTMLLLLLLQRSPVHMSDLIFIYTKHCYCINHTMSGPAHFLIKPLGKLA